MGKKAPTTEKKISRKKLALIILVCVLLILLFQYVHDIISQNYYHQWTINYQTQKAIDHIEKECQNLKDSVGNMTKLFDAAGTIDLKNEETLDSLIKEKNRLIDKLKEDLKKQQVVEGDYKKLLVLEVSIKREIKSIIEKHTAKAKDFASVAGEIEHYNRAMDSLTELGKQRSNKQKPTGNYKEEWKMPDVNLLVRPLHDCSVNDADYFNPEKITCFEVVIEIKEYQEKWNVFYLKYQNKQILPFKLMSNEQQIIYKKTDKAKLTIDKKGTIKFYLIPLNKVIPGECVFLLTQYIDGETKSVTARTIPLDHPKVKALLKIKEPVK